MYKCAIQGKENEKGAETVSQYNGSLTREQFMFREMRIVARLYQQGLTDSEILEQVCRENLFQYPTEREIKGKCKTALKRLSYIAESDTLVDILANGSPQEARQAALVAMMAQSRLLYEFMTEVIGEKYCSLDATFTSKDMNLFFARLCEKDEGVANWSAATVKRIKSVLMNVLRENGYLEKVGSERLCPVMVSDAFRQALKEAEMQRFSAVFYGID